MKRYVDEKTKRDEFDNETRVNGIGIPTQKMREKTNRRL